MHCIFCKQVSDNSVKIEHIIPESLGNKDHILPKGIVCDICNQYFGTKVEKQLLEQPFFRHLRHRQAIHTKHNKSVSWEMYSLFPAMNIENFLNRTSPKESASTSSIMQKILSQGNLFYSPHIASPRPNDVIVSRFLAKVAVEALAQRVYYNIDFLKEIVKNDGLDPIREYARYGKGVFWPYSQRQIYSEDNLFTDANRAKFQVLHEYNIVSFHQHEYHLILAICGYEFAINLNGRDLESFNNWLNNNQNKSPLIYDKFPNPNDNKTH